MRHVHWLLIAMGALLGGCFGSPAELGVGMNDLVELEPATEPLEELDGDEDWAGAPAGCEGRLSDELGFRIASLDGGLVAAIGIDGEIVCVDSVEAVQAELRERGERERARALAGSFIVAATLAVADPRPTNHADPTPQPNRELTATWVSGGSGGQSSDPTPQPNRGP